MRGVEREVAEKLVALLPRIAGARDRNLVKWLRDEGLKPESTEFTDATSTALRRLVQRYAAHLPAELRERAQLELAR